MMCANCFRAEVCEKEVLSPIGLPDAEVVSLLPRPSSPHSPLVGSLSLVLFVFYFAATLIKVEHCFTV